MTPLRRSFLLALACFVPLLGCPQEPHPPPNPNDGDAATIVPPVTGACEDGCRVLVAHHCPEATAGAGCLTPCKKATAEHFTNLPVASAACARAHALPEVRADCGVDCLGGT